MLSIQQNIYIFINTLIKNASSILRLDYIKTDTADRPTTVVEWL
jgi:hypothetical protein